MRGDISSTLLELLNPEQSNQFRDSYLDLEFDFSQCIFICTSNSTQNMLGPLLDRIEVINVPAYLPVEKMNIAKNYLVPKFENEYGFNEGNNHNEVINITDAAIMKIINNYCGYEAGVRNLSKCVDRIFRKITARLEMLKTQDEVIVGEKEAACIDFVEEQIQNKIVKYQVNTQNLENFLDIAPQDDNYYAGINEQLPVGCSNGLAFVNDG